VQVGDLVIVTFGHGETDVTGIFIEDDTVSCGENEDGDKILTRAHVLWEGVVYSTPLDQMRIINEYR